MLKTLALALAFALAGPAAAQTLPPVGSGPPRPSASPPLQILVYTPQGQPMALTPHPAPPALQASPLRALIEDTPGRIVVVRHAPQPAIPLQGGGALQIESIAAFEPGYEQQRLFGLRITVDRPELPERERTFYLEPRDVDPLLRAIEALEEIAASAGNPTDSQFYLPEGFGLGFRSVAGRLERLVRASRGEAHHFVLPGDGLARVRDALEAARRGIFGG